MNITQTLRLKNKSKSFYSLFILGFVLVLLSTTFFFLTTPVSTEAPTQPPATVTIPAQLLPTAELPARPARLLIPAIAVDAAVQYVGLESDGSGAMAVPSNFTDVGWYKHGVRPGTQGSAVIAGHYNGKDIPEAVFYDLDALRIGDEVTIMNASNTIERSFRVVKIASYEYDVPTTDVFISNDGRERLNLITCGGRWLAEVNRYDTRTVVFTERMVDGK